MPASPRGPPDGGKSDGVDVYAGSSEHPGDDRVATPHVACPELVASPHQGGNERQQIEDGLCLLDVIGDAMGGASGVAEVGDRPVAPATYLVPEHAEPPSPSESDRALGDDAAGCAAPVGNRCHLDHVVPVGEGDIEHRVVELASAAPLDSGRTAS